jgi:hypothetical protein
MLGPILAAFMILCFRCASDLAQDHGCGRGELQDANLPKDTTRREVKRASDEEARARRERELSVPPVFRVIVSYIMTRGSKENKSLQWKNYA